MKFLKATKVPNNLNEGFSTYFDQIDVFVIQEDEDGDGCHLIRMFRGKFIGDTWHEKIYEAELCAQDEVGNLNLNWVSNSESGGEVSVSIDDIYEILNAR